MNPTIEATIELRGRAADADEARAEAVAGALAGPGSDRRDAGGGTPARPRRRTSTALRLAAFHTIVLCAMLGIVVVAFAHQFAASNRTLATNALSGELHTFSTEAVGATGRGQDLFTFAHHYLRTHSLPSGDRLVVSVPKAGLVGSAGAGAVVADPTIRAWLRTPPATTSIIDAQIGGTHTEVLAAPIRIGASTAGTFVATTGLGTLERQRSSVLLLAIAEAAVAVAAGSLGAYLLLRRLLRKVGRITTTAGEIERGDLDRRLGDQGTDDEVSDLAHTFDAMLDRIARSMGAQRRLLSDVSHQLRSPLTAARGHLEVMARTGYNDRAATAETVDIVLDELEHMGTMVDQLLMLGRAIEPDFLEVEPVDLRALVADVYEAGRVLGERTWSVSAVPDVVIWADAAKLRGALLNVVDNAVKVTGHADRIALAAGVLSSGEVELAVDDAGPGIPVAQRDAVLERFKRVPGQGVPGTGLGLAIADAVARAHAGAVRIGSSALGGARVSIVLPPTSVWRPPPLER